MGKLQLKKYNKIDRIYFIGDVHGHGEEIINKICLEYKESNCLLVFLGDFGVGFIPAFDKYFNRLNRTLRKANNFAAVISRNHDDPSYFQHPDKNKKYQKQNISLIPDYTLLDVSNADLPGGVAYKSAAILCIGGAISIDRLSRVEGKTYWKDEDVKIDQRALADLFESNVRDFDFFCLATHEAPSFAYPRYKANTSQWFLNDPTLERDINTSRGKLDYIYNELKAYGIPPNKWYYGHHHMTYKSIYDKCELYLQDINEIKPLWEYNNN